MRTNRTKSLRRWPLAAALASTLVLAACGGGGGGDGGGSAGGGGNTPTTQFVPGSQVPVSATTSVAGVLEFIMGLFATTSENGEPIVLGDAVLSTSESEPATPLQ